MIFLKNYHPQIDVIDHPDKLASIHFEPCTHINGCPIPINKEWSKIGKYVLPLMRLAFLISEQDKSQTMETISGMDLDHRSDLIQDFEELAGWLRGNLKLLETAQARTAIVCATLVRDDDECFKTTKFRSGKVAYIVEGKRSHFDMSCPSGSALLCATRTEDIEDVIGEAAIIGLEDGKCMFCEIQRGSRKGYYDILVCEELVLKDAVVKWAEPLTATLSPYAWQRIKNGDTAEYSRLVALHPVPVLQVSEGGQAICRAGTDD